MTELEHRSPRQRLVPLGGHELFAADMTATFSADVTLADAQQRLSEVDQWLPIDGDPAQPLGRLVEINSTGPLRLGYGAWRDLLLGCQFENGRGELITAGGRAVKNVAGYDLTKFMVGQQGAFGRVVTITTRTYRRPVGGIFVRLEPKAIDVTGLLATNLRPQWMMLTADGLVLGYLGDAAYLDLIEREALAKWPGSVMRRSLEEDVQHRATTFSATYDRGVTLRASVPPARVFDLAGAMPGHSWAADVAFGVARANVADDAVDPFRRSIEAAGGAAWRESGATIDDVAGDEVQRRVLGRLAAAFGSGEGPS